MLFDQGIDIPVALTGASLNVVLEPERARFNVRLKSKDVAAGAVLLSAAGAAAVGAIIFTPYLLDYL